MLMPLHRCEVPQTCRPPRGGAADKRNFWGVMKTARSVNEALDLLDSLNGQPVEIEGILVIEPEGYELLHYPRAERRATSSEGEVAFKSSFWLAFGNGGLQPNHTALARWQGKRVRVHGVIHTTENRPVYGALGTGGFGLHGFWPAEIECYSIQRVTAEERRENDA